MIQSFHDKLTAAVSNGHRPKGFPPDLFERVRRKLVELDAAERL